MYLVRGIVTEWPRPGIPLAGSPGLGALRAESPVLTCRAWLDAPGERNT